MAYGDTSGGAAAPYKTRKRRKLKLQKVATGLGANKIKPSTPKQVGGGVAAPAPVSTYKGRPQPREVDRYSGLLPNGKRYRGRGRALGLRKQRLRRRRRRSAVSMPIKRY